MTRIGVLGAGAMGSYFGAMLSLAGHDVVLLDIDADRMSAIDRHGVVLVRDDRRDVVRLHASTSPGALSASEVVIVLTKANVLEAALTSARLHLAAARSIVVLPNGLGCGRTAARIIPPDLIIYGATEAGAILDGDAVVRETVIGTTYLGRLGMPPDSTAIETGQLLGTAGLRCEVSDGVESWIWTKLLVNVAFNAVTALTGLRNGALVDTESGQRLLKVILDEVTAVAQASGVEFNCENPLEYVTKIGNQIAPNQSSMLQDLLRNRLTEVDYLNGAIVDTASRLGLQAPINEALTHLVHMKEQELQAAAAAQQQEPIAE